MIQKKFSSSHFLIDIVKIVTYFKFKEQTVIYKTLLKKLKLEQHKSH